MGKARSTRNKDHHRKGDKYTTSNELGSRLSGALTSSVHVKGPSEQPFNWRRSVHYTYSPSKHWLIFLHVSWQEMTQDVGHEHLAWQGGRFWFNHPGVILPSIGARTVFGSQGLRSWPLKFSDSTTVFASFRICFFDVLLVQSCKSKDMGSPLELV